MFAEELARRLREAGHEPVEVFHRELGRDEARFRVNRRGMRLRRWLQPGMGVKRWLLLIFVGMVLLALGTAHVVRQVTQDLQPGGLGQALIDLLTLQFLPFPLRGLIVGGTGVALVGLGGVACRARPDRAAPARMTSGRSPTSSSRSGSWRAARASSRSAAGRACRRSCAASSSTPAT